MDELALSVAKRMSNDEWGIAVYFHPSQFIRSIDKINSAQIMYLVATNKVQISSAKNISHQDGTMLVRRAHCDQQ
jgi:hypothetical protein